MLLGRLVYPSRHHKCKVMLYVVKLILLIGVLVVTHVDAQESVIYGSVSGANGEALIGATIQINDSIGTITNSFGEFSIDVDNRQYTYPVAFKIRFRFLGYESSDTIIMYQGQNVFLPKT